MEVYRIAGWLFNYNTHFLCDKSCVPLFNFCRFYCLTCYAMRVHAMYETGNFLSFIGQPILLCGNTFTIPPHSSFFYFHRHFIVCNSTAHVTFHFCFCLCLCVVLSVGLICVQPKQCLRNFCLNIPWLIMTISIMLCTFTYDHRS